MGDAAVVATGAQAVVAAEGLVARRDFESVVAVAVAAGGRLKGSPGLTTFLKVIASRVSAQGSTPLHVKYLA